jgi:hypothetical protein
MDKQLDLMVRELAQHRCEYRRMPQAPFRLRFQIDHVIAEQHGGPTQLSNLALSCGRCNRHKGPKLDGFDRVNKAIVRLFHPRTDRGENYFRWNGAVLEGTTDIGRVRINVLAMNDAEEVATRLELIRSAMFELAVDDSL